MTKKISSSIQMASKVMKCIDCALLTILGLLCFRYVLRYGRLFAETHVQFNFLNFPVFIGEFVLAGCLLLFFIRVYLSKMFINKWHYLIIFYFVFVLAKAWWGYVHWGPLAFRDAALFYYAAFAVIAYYAYRSDYFNRFMILAGYAALLWMYFDFNDFWLVGRILFGLILAYRYPERWVGVLMAIGILVFTPYQYFMNVSRTVILGNFISISFLAITSIFLLERKIRSKIFIVGIVFVIAFGSYIFYFSNNIQAQTIFNLKRLVLIFNELEAEIELYKPKYTMTKIPVARIYNPDTVLNEQDQKVITKNLEAVENDFLIEKELLSKSPVVKKNPGLTVSKVQHQEKDSAHKKQQEESPPIIVPEPPQKEVVEPVLINEDQKQEEASTPAQTDDFIESVKFGNAVFRLFIWRDVLSDLIIFKPIAGFDFGKPFRSESLEIIHSAVGEWGRDGWIAMHNSYLNILYRSGLFGIGFIFIFFSVFAYLVKVFIRVRSMVGLTLCAILLGWFITASFALVLDIPYNAIPVWTLYGLTLAFAHQQLKKLKLKNNE